MKKMTIVSLMFLCLAVQASTSYYPEDLVARWQNGSLAGKELRNSLYDVLSLYHRPTQGGSDELLKYCNEGKCYKHFSLGYTKARKEIMGNIHLKQDGYKYYLEDVYCNRRFTSGVGPGKVPNASTINVEHTWPQSRFGGSHQSWQKSDLHHLFPVDSRANSSRGNLPFASIVDGKYPHDQCDDSLVGYPETYYGNKQRYFQVPPIQQGNTARAILYFAVRYKRYVDPTEELYLRLWHELDPVDEEEMIRNELIFELQKNRNPFIDYPELVDLIDNF